MIIDYEALANSGMSADQLASTFFNEYFKDTLPVFPINPFQMLTSLGVLFLFRPFKKFDGLYIPAEDEDDIPFVAINLNRPITRQRYSAAHELCHFLKDSNKQFACVPNSKEEIEKYAERFAAELLMPTLELRKQASRYQKNGFVDFDSVLLIADFFGVSFQACLYRIAYKLHIIDGDIDSKSLRKMMRKYSPDAKRKERGLHSTVLYEQLIDAMNTLFIDIPDPDILMRFKSEYIFQDSCMEGIDIERETAAEIVVDLRINKKNSEYCKEQNQNIIEVAGLTFAYDYAFEECKGLITIYDAKTINEKLFSTAPYPEFGGLYRTTNTLVLGAKFETVDYRDIPKEMKNLDHEVETFMEMADTLSKSAYIERVATIHHRLTVIHAFRDGNGRTSRVFANMMLLKRNIPPIFFPSDQKIEYKAALKEADLAGSYDSLFECFFKSILNTYASLTDFQM